MKLKDFDQIKLLVKAGLNNRQISDITGRSDSTVARLKKYEYFADYQKGMRAEKARQLAAKKDLKTVHKVTIEEDELQLANQALFIINKLKNQIAERQNG